MTFYTTALLLRLVPLPLRLVHHYWDLFHCHCVVFRYHHDLFHCHCDLYVFIAISTRTSPWLRRVWLLTAFRWVGRQLTCLVMAAAHPLDRLVSYTFGEQKVVAASAAGATEAEVRRFREAKKAFFLKRPGSGYSGANTLKAKREYAEAKLALLAWIDAARANDYRAALKVQSASKHARAAERAVARCRADLQGVGVELGAADAARSREEAQGSAVPPAQESEPPAKKAKGGGGKRAAGTIKSEPAAASGRPAGRARAGVGFFFPGVRPSVEGGRGGRSTKYYYSITIDLLPSTSYLLPPTHYPPITYYLLPSTPLPTTYYLIPCTYYLMPTAYFLL